MAPRAPLPGAAPSPTCESNLTAITFESFFYPVVSATLSDDLAVSRYLWDDGADLPRHARSHLASLLQASRSR